MTRKQAVQFDVPDRFGWAGSDLLGVIAAAMAPMMLVELLPFVVVAVAAGVVVVAGCGIAMHLARPVWLQAWQLKSGARDRRRRVFSCGESGRMVMKQRFRRFASTRFLPDGGKAFTVRVGIAEIASKMNELGFVVADRTDDRSATPKLVAHYRHRGTGRVS